MSHLTYIKTKIKNAQVLETVLTQMIADGLGGILTGAKLKRNAIEPELGNNETIDFVIRRTNENIYGDCSHFGFNRNSLGEFGFLGYYGNDSVILIGKLASWYARENAIAALISQGFSVDSIAEENGEIKILAGKWS